MSVFDLGPAPAADAGRPHDLNIDDRALLTAVRRLRDAGLDLRPLMAEIAALLESSTQRNFARQRDPRGRKWTDLSPRYEARRRRQRTWPGMILHVSGRLSGSVVGAHGADWAKAGTNIVYAGVHHFGWPSKSIPARPSLGFNNALIGEVRAAVRRHFGAAAGLGD